MKRLNALKRERVSYHNFICLFRGCKIAEGGGWSKMALRYDAKDMFIPQALDIFDIQLGRRIPHLK